MTILNLQKVNLMFPNIYEPRFYEDRKKYATAFEADEATTKLLAAHGVRPKAQSELFNTNSNYAPLLTCEDGDYERIDRYFHLADLRNIKRDALFRGMVADIDVKVFGYDTPEYRGVGLALQQITFNSMDIANAFNNYKIPGADNA